MRPRGLDGTSWSAEDSHAMLQHFHRQTRDELHARDVLRGLPKSGACGRFVNGVFRVDPRLSAIKHSGAESIELRGRKWAAFCAEARDPAIELPKIGLTPHPVDIPATVNVQGLDATVQAAIAEGIKAGIAAALGNGHSVAPKRGRKPELVEETQ